MANKNLEKCFKIKDDIDQSIALKVVLHLVNSEVNEAYNLVVNSIKKKVISPDNTPLFLVFKYTKYLILIYC